MEISVALDGEKKRDLRFFAGDDMSLTIVVYAHDGDVDPITVTNARFAAADGSLPMDSEFVVPSNFFGRVNYRIVGEVDDITTTLAYGVMQTEGGWPSLFCGCYGSPWPYGIVGKSDNITVLDAHQNFDGIVSVEGALEQLGDFKKSVGDIDALVETATEAADYVESVLPDLLTKTEAVAENGAQLVGTPEGTVQEALDGRVKGADLASSGGASLVSVQVKPTSEIVTLERRAKEVYYLQADGGVVADWNGTTGTDQTAKIQAATDSFGGARGVEELGTGRILCDSARLDFKKVVMRGTSTTDNAASGGVELYIGALGGLYTSIEDNNGPRHENLRITSSETRTDNGQICLDMKGVNYPALQNVTSYGGGTGLRLSGGTVAESHYGNFLNVNISRAYTGISVDGGNRTQTHLFTGGRIWDCVRSYVNTAGTGHIVFNGTAFEGDRAVEHVNAGDDPNAAQTILAFTRDECDFAPLIPNGMIGLCFAHMSGYKKPREFATAGGEIVWHGQALTAGVRGIVEPVGRNLLRNPELTPDLGGTVRGWTIPSGAALTELNGPRGRIWKWTRAAAFQAWEQNGINLKKGRYVAGFVVDKENTPNSGAIILQMTNSAGTLLVQGVDVDVDFASANFTSISGGHLGSGVYKEFEVLQDLTNVRFRAGINSMPVGQLGFFGSPFLVNGLNADHYENPHLEPEATFYGTAPPTTGVHRAGETTINPVPTPASPVKEWSCITAGTPGTWRATSWLVTKGNTAGRPTLTANDVGVRYLDTTLAAAGKPVEWTGTAWVDSTGVAV